MTAAGPSTRIQTSGGSNSWKYYYTGVCPGTSGVVYTVSVWIKNQGTTSMKISGNIVDGPVIAPGTTQLVSFTETGNGVSCIQLGIATVNVGDGMDVLAFAPAMSASGGSNMVPAANQNFSGWVAYQGAAVTVTQGQTPMVVDSMDYLPYGEQIAGSWGSTHKFTGKERDSETNLDYLGARYYGNWLGRFLTPDWAAKPVPIPFGDPSSPQSLNLYAYVKNNPTTVDDPDGHQDSLATAAFERDVKDLIAGRITKEEYWARINARGAGAAVGCALACGGMAAASITGRILAGYALASVPVVSLIVMHTLDAVTPGPSGSLTISMATRLTATEISTGVRLAEQTGKALVQSEHVGAEFVDAAGKTYDAVNSAAAYANWFRDGGKAILANIASTANKAVDYVAVDLKGASKEQITAIKDFVKTLTKQQQAKIKYVQ